MTIRSLGRQTDFIFAKFSGSIEDKGKYTLVKTPSNPSYHWGNYIIFDRPPKSGDLFEWKALFDKEFVYYSNPHHYSFTWDTEFDDKGDCHEFLEDGFEFDSAVVLTSNSLQKPPHPNHDILVRKIISDADWKEVIKLQILCADPKYFNDYYVDFKKNQMSQYRKMSEQGLGNWFGAFINDRLVGDLGTFFDGKIGRFQSVETHPELRRQGICGNLVFTAGLTAHKEFGVETLVMEADPEYHAARVYESVGFVLSETNYSLSWWKR